MLHDVFEAVAAKTPGIAKPIIDKAVEDKKITEAQADQLRNMQRRFKVGPGRGHGPGRATVRAAGPGPPPDFDVPRRRPLHRAASTRRAPSDTRPLRPLPLEGAGAGAEHRA